MFDLDRLTVFLHTSSQYANVTLVIAASAITAGIIVYGISQFGLVGQAEKSEPVETTPNIQKVAALGRLEPRSRGN
ncbi:hypothetical protein [Nostoc sp. ChiSLP03a]|uniref:hypothetical protein n=1 Tax=Nostoc sp. ChiSLP03a TaxID=3075380 RepID=UPI002AD344D0|nr:hypothetical protein [Nostoc sp. ChiSLP03a]MDZ8214206.1 hypothetical protein [Nostoc sp. ChiSLP03a]